MNIVIRDTLWEDIPIALDAMRDTTAKESETIGFDAGEGLTQAFASSDHTMTGLVDGKLVCIWGVCSASLLSHSGYVWMFLTKNLEEFPLIFARHSRKQLAALRESGMHLHGYVDAENKMSIRWLDWLGFDVGPSARIGSANVRLFNLRNS